MSEDTQAAEAPKEETEEKQTWEDRLEKVLSDHEKVPEPTEDKKDDTDLAKRLEKLERERVEDDNERAVLDSISRIKSTDESLKGIDDSIIEGIMHAEARKDSRIMLAFANQKKNPAEWSAVEKMLAEKASGLVVKPASNDVEGALASVQGVSNSAPPKEDIKPQAELASMTPTEYAAYKASLG